MSQNQNICFLDFEASGLGPRSYPIQIAYSIPSGQIECWLIRPAASWQDWDSKAESEIHQISRDMLWAQGLEPKLVMARMNQALAGRTVYCDCVDMDRRWLLRLTEEARTGTDFVLKDIQDLFPAEMWQPRPGQESIYKELSALAWKATPGRRHQADTDVRYLQNLHRLVSQVYT